MKEFRLFVAFRKGFRLDSLLLFAEGIGSGGHLVCHCLGHDRKRQPAMEKPNFEEAIRTIVSEDKRYQPDGYHFLRDALDHTVSELRNDELEEHRHVTGPELLNGVVAYAVQEFGSMAVAVLESWGIGEGEDIGAMVFQLIEAGAFGRSEEDSPNDFKNVLDLREELLSPFRPRKSNPVSDSDSGNEPPSRGNQPAKPSEL